MKILEIIQLRNMGPTCQKCLHFENDPDVIEQTYPGLTSMSSGYASVRDRDGLCHFHQLYLSAGNSCPYFVQQSNGG